MTSPNIRVRTPGLLVVCAALVAVLVAGLVPASAVTRTPRAPRDGIAAVWLGRQGDLMSEWYFPNEWNQPDGVTEATFLVTFGVRGRLTEVEVDGIGGCFWVTDDRLAFSVGVTEVRRGRLLNSPGHPASVDVQVRRGDSLILRVQEPHWDPNCASGGWVLITARIDGQIYAANFYAPAD